MGGVTNVRCQRYADEKSKSYTVLQFLWKGGPTKPEKGILYCQRSIRISCYTSTLKVWDGFIDRFHVTSPLSKIQN